MSKMTVQQAIPRKNLVVAIVAAITLLFNFLVVDVRAEAVELPGTFHDLPSSQSALTPEEWNLAVAQLIASDVPRTVDLSADGKRYTFHIPVKDPSVPTGNFDLAIVVPPGH